MNFTTVIFILLATLIVVTTAIAITRRHLVHAVVFLVFSFFGSAMLFYLFGAPILAALEVIIYAGAVMILFLFIVIMLEVERSKVLMFPIRQWIPAACFSLVYLVIGTLLIIRSPHTHTPIQTGQTEPGAFGRYLFERHWLSIEIVSLLLLVALIGALLLGRRFKKPDAHDGGSP